MIKTVYLVASGDLRLSANRACNGIQMEMEQKLTHVLNSLGVAVIRAHEYDEQKQHGFIDSQKMGIEVFKSIPKDAAVIVAEAVWQYSHHVFAGLLGHGGKILTVANWSGTAPGLVGLLNLNACLTKEGIKYSTIWSENFDDEFFINGVKQWLDKGKITHNSEHITPFKDIKIKSKVAKVGKKVAKDLMENKAILGVFDEGCMGMYNAIIPDNLLHKTGLFKERLSQSALYAKMLTVSDKEAKACYDWIVKRGMKFHFGKNEETELTKNQVLLQCKMYIAAVRIADEFGCSAIGIQYQQGLKDLTPASDLAEGLLNNTERPPVYCETTGKELFANEALPHFNEVDECAGLDALVTYRLWRLLGLPPENTLHDLRWGRQYTDENIDEFVWVLEISGAAPPNHFISGYAGASGMRQPAMYFRLGGSSLRGISKPGHIVWSRVYVKNNSLCADIGLAKVLYLPTHETEDRWNNTTKEWPIMHTVFQGISRNQMMARHKSNHIQVVYANDEKTATEGLLAKATAFSELGIKTYICGELLF